MTFASAFSIAQRIHKVAKEAKKLSGGAPFKVVTKVSGEWLIVLGRARWQKEKPE